MKTKRISILTLILVLAFMIAMSVVLTLTQDTSYAASYSVGFAIKEKSDVYFVETGNNKVQNTVTGNDGKLAHMPELYRTDTLDYHFDGWYIANSDTLVTTDTVLNGDVTLVDRWTYTPFDANHKVGAVTINNTATLAVGTKQGEYSSSAATADVDGITGGTSYVIYKGLNKSGDPLVGDEEVEINKNYSVATTITLKSGYKFDDQVHFTASEGLAADYKFKGNFWTTSWSTDATQVEVIINFVNSGEYYFLQQPESRDLENYAEYHYYYLLNDTGADPLESVVLQYKDNQDQWALFGPATMVVSPYKDKTHTFRLIASYEHGTVESEPWTITWSCLNPTIDSVTLGVDIPANGQSANYLVSKSDNRYVFSTENDANTQNGVSWTGSISGLLPKASAVFNNTEDYTITIKIVAQEGYSFSNVLTAKINGVRDAQVSGDSEQKTITYTFEKDAPLTHTVYFNESLHGTGSMEPATVVDGAEYTLPACTFTPDTNYTFAAWSISSELYKPGDVIVVNSNQHVFAVWQASSTPASENFTTQPVGGTTAAYSYFTVSFEVDNGLSYNAVSVLEYDENTGNWNSLISARDYVYTQVDGKIKKVSFCAENACSKILRVYATNTNTSTVVAKSDTFTVNWTPSEMTKQPQGATVDIGATYTITWDTTFDARFRILEYIDDDWAAIAQTTDKSYSVTSNTAKSRTFQICADIPYTLANGSTNYVYDVVVSQSIIVTWAEPAPTEYMVSYNDNGGSGSMIGDMVADGEEFTLENCDYEAPDGQQFKGWAVGSVDATPLKQPGDKITITANTIIYAIWEDIPAATYTVSFNANGGTGTMAAVTGVSGNYTLPANGFTAPDGKQFKGWSLAANGNIIDMGIINVAVDITLYAIWEDIPAVTYAISFNANGGTGTMAPVQYAGTYTLPQSTFTAPNGKQFKGWALSANGSKINGTTTVISADTVLYAIWEDIPVVNPDPETPDPEQGGSGENGNNNSNSNSGNIESNSAKKPLSGGGIAGIVIAVVVVLAGAGVAVFFVLKAKGKFGKKETPKAEEPKEEDTKEE